MHRRGAVSSSNRKDVRGRMPPETPFLTSDLREYLSAQVSRSTADPRKTGSHASGHEL